MVNEVIGIHRFNLSQRINAIQDYKISYEDKRDLVKFLSDASIGRVNKGKRLTTATLIKYLFTLKVALEFIKKPTSKLKLKDVEGLERALSSDKLLSQVNKPFSPSSKANIKTDLKTYLKWKLGKKAVSLTNWLDCRIPNKTPDYLSESDIIKLFRGCKSNSERFLIAVLFDTGCRAEEFHNIRFEDIEMPSSKDNYVRITLKEEYSKTNGRVICLYWSYSLDAVRDYLEERKQDKHNLSDAVYVNSYDNNRQVLNRLGQKILGKPIHYHLFRHSSATHYATKLNRQELCYRYGWTFSSDMPDVYISRAGMVSKALDATFKATDFERLKKELIDKSTEQAIEIDQLKKMVRGLVADSKLINKRTGIKP